MLLIKEASPPALEEPFWRTVALYKKLDILEPAEHVEVTQASGESGDVIERSDRSVQY